MQITKEKFEQQQSPREKVYRYLGLLALINERDSNESFLEQQIVTELAESLDAEMGTHDNPIVLQHKNEELLDANGKSMRRSLRNWSNTQTERALNDDRLSWFAAIASAEADEQDSLLQFMESASNNDTLLVVSPFPEDAFNNPYSSKTVEQEGFRPDLKRAFIRVYEKQDDTLLEHVQSVDNSSIYLWNTILVQMGLSTVRNAQDLLEQRYIFKNTDAAAIVHFVVEKYDEALGNHFSGQYTYGRKAGGNSEANSFVQRNQALIKDTITSLKEISATNQDVADAAANRILYDSKALLNVLYEQEKRGSLERFVIGSNEVREARLMAGAAAAEAGKTFAGCSGMSVAEIVTSAASITAESSFSISMPRAAAKGLEIRPCTKCPMCDKLVDAIYDPREKRWSCVEVSCKGYDKQMVNKAFGIKTKNDKQGERDFGDILREAFFGDEAKKAKKQQAALSNKK